MAKANKMGMTDSQLRVSKALRFARNEKARRKRQKRELDDSGLTAIFDAVQAGEITVEEGARQMRMITSTLEE